MEPKLNFQVPAEGLELLHTFGPWLGLVHIFRSGKNLHEPNPQHLGHY